MTNTSPSVLSESSWGPSFSRMGVTEKGLFTQGLFRTEPLALLVHLIPTDSSSSGPVWAGRSAGLWAGILLPWLRCSPPQVRPVAKSPCRRLSAPRLENNALLLGDLSFAVGAQATRFPRPGPAAASQGPAGARPGQLLHTELAQGRGWPSQAREGVNTGVRRAAQPGPGAGGQSLGGPMGWNRRGRVAGAQGQASGSSGKSSGDLRARAGRSAGRVPWQENAGRSPERRPLRGQRAVSRQQGQTSGRGQTSRRDQVQDGASAPPGEDRRQEAGGLGGHPGKGTGYAPALDSATRPQTRSLMRGMQCSRGVGADQRGGNADAGWSAGNFRTGTPSLIIQALALPGCSGPGAPRTNPASHLRRPGAAALRVGVLSEVGLRRHVAAPCSGGRAGAPQSPNPGARCWGVSCLEGGDETRLADRKTSCTSFAAHSRGN